MRIVTIILFLCIIIGLGFAAMFSNVITDYYKIKDLQIPDASGFTIANTIKLHSKVLSTPQTSQNIVYVQTATKVIAISLESQSIVWERRIKGYDPNHAMLATENIIFVPSNRSNILALNSISGETLWETDSNETQNFLSDIAYQGNRVFIAFHNQNLEARLLSTGELLWSINTPSRSEINLLPINEDVLLFSSYYQLTAINSRTGAVIWNRQVPQEEFTYIEGSNLIIALESLEEELVISGINPKTGILLWSTPINSIRVKCLSNDGDSVYISGGGLVKFDINLKSVVWVSSLVENLVCPIIYEEEIFVIKNGRDMYIFNKKTGNLESRMKLLWLLFSNTNIDPVINENNLIIVTKRNSISIFRIDS